MEEKSRLNRFAQSFVSGDLKEGINVICETLDDLINKISGCITFDEFLENISKFADSKIIETEKKHNLKYVAGKCNLEADIKAGCVITNLELYYKNSNNAWVKNGFGGKTQISKFTDDSINKEINDLIKNGMQSISVIPPK